MTKANAARCVAAMLAFLPLPAARASIPTAHCRGGDKTESGLQGLTTPAEIASGAAAIGFNCNMDIVGQYQGEGASWQLTAWKNCAYFDQKLNSAESLPGTVVVDVSDPKNPKPTTLRLTDNAMLDPWESLKVNPARQLLAGDQKSGTGFVVYDISQDCLHPVQKAFINIPGMFGHTGQWAPDGNTYYVTPLRTPSSPSTPRIRRTRRSSPAQRDRTDAARTVSSPLLLPTSGPQGGTTSSSPKTEIPRTSPCSARERPRQRTGW